MDRAALARELFDLHQQMRDQVQALMLDASKDTRATGRRLGDLVSRADRIVEGYVASADSGGTRITVKG